MGPQWGLAIPSQLLALISVSERRATPKLLSMLAEAALPGRLFAFQFPPAIVRLLPAASLPRPAARAAHRL